MFPSMTHAKLMDHCHMIKGRVFALAVEDLIRSAEENANDTLYLDKACEAEEWEQVFHNTLQCLLTERGVPTRVINWFGRRGVRG